jgi:hypothetical protein
VVAQGRQALRRPELESRALESGAFQTTVSSLVEMMSGTRAVIGLDGKIAVEIGRGDESARTRS